MRSIMRLYIGVDFYSRIAASMKSAITPGYNFNLENLVSAFLGRSSLNTCGANVVLIQYSSRSILRIK